MVEQADPDRAGSDGQPGSNTGPLAGVKVLDLTRVLAGPSSTQLLGDYGADVIKIEKPGAGDDTRKWGPPYVRDAAGKKTSESAYYLSTNRNKRSVAVDISSPRGAGIIRQLAAQCDILMENFKVGGLKKYGLDYDSLKADNPALVYCSITGFGHTGPNAAQPGYDLMAQGYGGIMSLTGEPDGEPVKVGVGVADLMCGLYAATAVIAALRHRDSTGKGQHIDISLVDTQIAWLVNEGVNYLTSGKVPVRRGNQHPNIVPYQVFETSDGHVIVAVGNDTQFARFCATIGREDLAMNPRFSGNVERVANRDELISLLKTVIATHSKTHLLESLRAAGVPSGPINDLREVFDSDQAVAREMRISMPHDFAGSGVVDLIGNPVKFSETPVSYRHPPPVCGAHTQEVLDDWLGDAAPRQQEDAGE